MGALDGVRVVDFTRQLPGPFASRELLRLGATVVKVEPPEGDPTPEPWYSALNDGKDVVSWDARAGTPSPAVADADVVLEGFRPGVFERLGVKLAPDAILCSITGYGATGLHALDAGHDLNYLGYAGVLADTAPAVPPVQVADLAAGAQRAVIEVLAALLERGRTGAGARIVVSMTHNAHELGRFGDPLTGRLACYRIYPCADGRFLTVAALEEKFFVRLCEVVGREELAARQYEPAQDALAAELADVFATKPLAEWLALFDGEDVCAGPVATYAEAASTFGRATGARAPDLGEHTDAWRSEQQA